MHDTPPTIVDRQEFERRLQALRRSAADDGFDALLVAGKGHWWTGRGYLRYLTDFHLWGHDGLLLLPPDRAPSLAITSPAVGTRIAERGLVTDVHGDFNLVPAVTSMIEAAGLARARIGVCGYDWIIPAGLFAALERALPTAALAAADAAFDRVRQRKSALELAQARELWPVMRRAMAAVGASLRPGVTRQEVASEAVRSAHADGARDVLVFIGEDIDDVNPPTSAPLRCDGMVRVHLEICGTSGHWCERTVMFAFREPTAEEETLRRAEVAAYDRVRAEARPGMTLQRLGDAFERAVGDEGIEILGPSHHFDFHGQGLDCIESPRYSSADPAGTHASARLEVGQVFSFHPARKTTTSHVWGPDIHDNVVVTEGGLERLSGDWAFEWQRMG